MPRLTNTKRELFAQNLFKGMTQQAAYEDAGYLGRGAGAQVNACKLAAAPEIQGRLDELFALREQRDLRAIELAVERTAITKQKVIEELAKIGFANMADYMRIGADGDPILDLGGITREQAAAIIEVTVEDFKDGRGEYTRDVRRIKFKLADKKGALVDIGKELGMFIERKEKGPPGSFADLDRAQLDAKLQVLLLARGMTERQARAFLRAGEVPIEGEAVEVKEETDRKTGK